MATSRLELYNLALRTCAERKLDSLSEDREPRRLLDEVWVFGNGFVRRILEQGHWNHAMRAVKVDSSSDVTPEFGFTFAFEKPSDFVRLNMISGDERFSVPLVDFEPEGDYYYADIDPIYLRFVSDDPDWGGDFSRWPETFSQWAGHELGVRLASSLKNDIDKDALKKEANKLLIDARSKDASEEPPRWPPLSSWAQSRFGRQSRRERGARNRLIG